MPYAAQTTVTPDRSMEEIRRLLRRYDADKIGFMEDDEHGVAVVMFRMQGRHVKFRLPLPSYEDASVAYTPTGKLRPRSTRQQHYEQEVRRRFRSLVLCLKAKLESIESGIETFDESFMPQIMLADGSTVSEFMVPQIEETYARGSMPQLLPGIGGYAEYRALPEGG